MEIAILSNGPTNKRWAGGREKRAEELASYLSLENKVDLVYPWDVFGESIFGVLFNKVLFFFFGHLLIKKKYDLIYTFRTPLFLFIKKGVKVLDAGRIWIWHWSPITLIDNLSDVLGAWYSEIIIYNSEASYNKSFFKYKGLALELGVSDTFKDMKMERDNSVLFVGRDGEQKNTNLIYRLAEKHPNIKFHIAGFKKEPTNNLIFHGRLSQQELALLYNKCSILLLPSKWESYGRVVAEANACGLVCLAFKGVLTPSLEQQNITVEDEEEYEWMIPILLKSKEKRVFKTKSNSEYYEEVQECLKSLS